MRLCAPAALAVLAGMATAANAALISFASESGPGPTIQSTYEAGTTTLTDVNNPTKLLRVSTDNGGTPNNFSRDVRLTLTATLTDPTTVGGNIIFRLDNFSFELRDANSSNVATNLLFRFTSFGRDQGVFLGLGNNGGSGIVAASITSDGLYQVGDAIASELGLAPGASTVAGQASFALTGFNPSEVSFLSQDGQTVGLANFTAGASFSGSFTAPTPGAIALAGIAGLALAFRRR